MGVSVSDSSHVCVKEWIVDNMEPGVYAWYGDREDHDYSTYHVEMSADGEIAGSVAILGDFRVEFDQ